MPYFRKKPVSIEAKQFTAEADIQELIVWIRSGGRKAYMGNQIRLCSPKHPEGFDYPTIVIETLEGEMTASLDDWIIKGVKGEFYPCKQDIFEATYEATE